jgi:hypothetical protein
MTSARPLPAPRVAPRHLRADGTTRPAPVPPAWFRTTSTAFSALKFAGLLRPAAGHEVRRVSPKPAPTTPTPSHRSGSPTGRGESGLAPRDANDPPKSSPRSQPYRVTTACSLRAVGTPSGGRAPCSPLPVGGSSAVRERPSTSRSCSANESVASDTLAGTGSLVPSMGLFPLRGPTSPAASLDFPGATRDPPKGEPSDRPSHGGDTPGWSRGHPSHAVGRSRRGSLSGGVVRQVTSAQARWGRPDRPP